ncbi:MULTISPECIES: (2Fe-2S)-binding protein [unclassified Xanthobacter]|uniref:(2Fe-2S)-binding protein n=1 Tax=unclassified Xanthobacter TaxID=2623496 RepID=UPI001EDE46F8|nr:MULTISPECIES: (2Fe-2S)-binding protein [unclassified Xanthobacter]
MIVCSCNVFSDRQVLDALAASDGMRTPGEVYRCLGCSPQCGRCARTIRAIMDQAQARSCAGCAEDCAVAALTGMVAAE